MGTNNFAPLVVPVWFWVDYMISLSDDKQADIIDAFGNASRCLGGILGVDGVCFGTVVGLTYPSELQLNGANTSDTEVGPQTL